MCIKLKTVPAIIAAAGLAVSGMAQVTPQTTRDHAENNRLIIDGKPVFVSGMNIAWNTPNSFGNDVGDSPLDVNAFKAHIQNVRRAGGNAVRWWLHTDAANCPKINSDGRVTGIGSRTIQNINTALDIAHENGVVVALCLFSFDLLVPGDGGKGTSYYPGYNLESNHKFLTDTAGVTSYINNALIPILEGVGNHPAIMAWEVFNEPEGMLQAENWGHVTRKISFDDILRFTNRVAGAVRRNSLKMVSTGIKEASYLRANNSRGWYTDARLIAAGGDQDGWLDFYMVHYYPQWQGTTVSPFHATAASWGADRPIVVGEFPGRDWGPGTGFREMLVADPGTPNDAVLRADGAAMTVTEAFQYAFNNGYAGALTWALTDPNFGTIAETGPALTYLYENHKDAIMIRDVDIEIPTGDLVMRLALNALPTITADWTELGFNPSPALNFATGSSLTFEIFVAPGSGTNLDINVVTKTGSGWDWTPGPTLKLDDYTQGQWHQVSVPVANFEGGASGLSDVRSLLFQFGATTGTPYTGTVFIDNVRIGNTVVSDFDNNTAWGIDIRNSAVDPANAAVSIVARSAATTSIRHGIKTSGVVSRMPIATVRGKILNVTGIDNSPMTVRLINVNGKTVARFNATGKGAFSLAKIPAGRYVVETRIGGKRAGRSAVIVK